MGENNMISKQNEPQSPFSRMTTPRVTPKSKSVNVLLFDNKSTDHIVNESPDEIDSDFEDLLDNDCDFISSDIEDDDDVKHLYSIMIPPNNGINPGDPPIKLNQSQSTESLFELEIVSPKSSKKQSDHSHINYSPKSPKSPCSLSQSKSENGIKPKLNQTQSNSFKSVISRKNSKKLSKRRSKKEDGNGSKHKHGKTLSDLEGIGKKSNDKVTTQKLKGSKRKS